MNKVKRILETLLSYAS